MSIKITPELVEAMERHVSANVGHAGEFVEKFENEHLSLTMNSRFEITELALHPPTADQASLPALAESIRACVNDAVRGVARRAGDQIARTFESLAGPQ